MKLRWKKCRKQLKSNFRKLFIYSPSRYQNKEREILSLVEAKNKELNMLEALIDASNPASPIGKGDYEIKFWIAGNMVKKSGG